MVPVRVELTDFLSHRRPDGTPVTFDFDGAKLWSVSGDNGAGKSAIFDAITWTLYGVHRGGRQDAQRLISHGASSLHAAFTFEVDGQRYRVDRSLRRRGGGGLKRSAQAWDPASSVWSEIPGTSAEAGFNRWRDELIGLSYDAFTHSVLLLQAGSDALIRSGAKDRFEVLAQLVDLTRYQALERRAQGYSSELAGRRRWLGEELERLAAVDPDERKAAVAEVKLLTKAHAECARAVEAQVEVLGGARRHEELARRLARAGERIGSTEKLVVDADRIRAEAGEHELLTVARPKLKGGIAALAAAGAADERAAEARRAAERVELVRLKRAAERARRAAGKAHREADADAAKASALATALPAIESVVERRLEVAEAEAEVAATGTVADLDATLKRFRAHLRELEREASKAVAAKEAAAKALAAREAELEEAQRQLQARRDARDEAVCSRCGQPVDEEHRAAELRRARDEVKDAERAAATARAEHAELAEAATAATAARDDAAELGRQAEGQRTEAKGAEQRLRRARAAAAKALRAAAFTDWGDRRQRMIATAAAGKLEAALEALEGEREALTARAAASAQAATEAEEEAGAAEQAHADAVDARAGLERTVEQARAESVAQCRQADVLLADVPAEWVSRARGSEDGAVLGALDARRAAVAKAAAELRAVERAESDLVRLRASVDELAEQVEALPKGQRVSVASADEALAGAREKLSATERALNDAQVQMAALKQREEDRADKLAEQKRTGRDARLAARMVQLLGRQGLQGQLLLDATRSLERLANETLVRLTGGALQLEIRIADRRGRDELSVYARDYNAGGERTDAAFLSGSEKFRVCVAMAAAIGAYGSGRRRIESLIIDEGFGSLDEQRRGDMIDELRRLAGLLERVIVVSHQADFHNRAQFPHGYRLRRVDGATTVERYI